ncbi:MAG: hypothetical protein QNJ54_31510 [Prochloraceae cyanobacterium]|nr:hypothetical protein [Prochloraceae cyanobacterium]
MSNHVIGGEGWSKKQMPNPNQRVSPEKGRGGNGGFKQKLSIFNLSRTNQ